MKASLRLLMSQAGKFCRANYAAGDNPSGSSKISWSMAYNIETNCGSAQRCLRSGLSGPRPTHLKNPASLATPGYPTGSPLCRGHLSD